MSYFRRFSVIVFFLFPSILFAADVSFGDTLNIKYQEIKNVSDTSIDLFSVFESILTAIIALLGLYFAKPILSKLLAERQITSRLEKIQESNSEIQNYNQELIDRYIPLTYTDDLLQKSELEWLYEEINKGYKISQNSSSDVTTFMFFLKNTLLGTIKHYRELDNSAFIGRRNILGFLIGVLESVNYYSTQVVNIPKSSKMINDKFISKVLEKYVTFYNFKKYKYFQTGVIFDPNSVHYTMFLSKVQTRNNILLSRSAFQIFQSPVAVAKLLLLCEIYAPLILKSKSEDRGMLGRENFSLYLVGFEFGTTYPNQIASKPIKYVKLYYTNCHENMLFVEGLMDSRLKELFTDNWILKSNFDLNKMIKRTNSEFESMKIEFEESYLKDSFNTNKKLIKKKLKHELQQK